MPAYQLPLAGALAGGALVSATTLLFVGFGTDDGKIKLPDEDADPDDPFNVTRAEDIIDGEPIDERGFWVKV
jgi:hypothetical protein